jgi:hypothetical protein
MADNSLGETQTFRRKITSADGTGIVEILNCATSFLPYASLDTNWFVGKNFYLEALSGAVYLPSIQAAPFPDIYPEMTAAEKIAAMIKIEEDYPFLGLRFHAKKGASGQWNDLATALLQNRGRETTIPFVIPYLTVNQLKLLSASDILGVSIINYGHGVLGIGDYINLEGDFRLQIDLIAKPVTVRAVGAAVPYGVDIGTSPVRFRNANANRAIFYATNSGNFNLWVAGTSAGLAVGTGMFLAANGGTLSLGETDNLNGELWAVAEGGTSRVAGVEASYV